LASDPSEGWEAIAPTFIATRSAIGRDVVRRWSARLQRGDTVLDVGCGSGATISETLIDRGFNLFGIDASPTLVSAFRRRFPQAVVACEAAQVSSFFNRIFDGAVAIGLLFLLTPSDQRTVLRRISDALKPGGHLLFSAPSQPCEWNDMLTGRPSNSLGFEEYSRVLQRAGMKIVGTFVDEGENHYFSVVKNRRLSVGGECPLSTRCGY
jgi:2-polyprenyl-3-methyl-5-hydroxy-6-metoxy-1,4-benzoquinol methylase